VQFLMSLDTGPREHGSDTRSATQFDLEITDRSVIAGLRPVVFVSLIRLVGAVLAE
jgi:hypothetical protein